MEKLSVDEFVAWLSRSCPDVLQASLDLIKSNRISGRRANSLSRECLHSMGIPYGDSVDIIEAINDKENFIPFNHSEAIQSSKQVAQPDASRSNIALPSVVHIISDAGVVARSSDVNRQECSVSDHGGDGIKSSDSESFSDDSGEENFESIKEYFTQKEFDDMSNYERKSYKTKMENYIRMVKWEIPCDEPAFMKKKTTASQKGSKKQAFKPSTTEAVARDTRAKIAEQQETQHGSKNRVSSSKAQSKDYKTAGSSAPSNSTSLTSTLLETPCRSNVNNDTSDSSAAPTSAPKTVSAKKPKKKKIKTITVDEAEYVSQLPKFDVKDILEKAGRRLKAVRKHLGKDGIVYGAERKLMIRTLVNHLHYVHVDHIKLVTMNMKEGLAASIVDEYPKFGDKSVNDKRSWWRLFERNGPRGFIANATINVFRKAEPEERHRSIRDGDGETSQSDDDDAEVGTADKTYFDKDAAWMSLMMPYAAHKAQLLEAMKRSCIIRKQWIHAMHPTITDVLSRYPHLMSYDGEVMEQEFELLHPGKGSLFIKVFPTLVNLIKDKISVEEFAEDDVNREIIGACFYICNSLPRPNLLRYQRRRKTGVIDSIMPELQTLMKTAPLGANINVMINEAREKAKGPVQPYLLALAPQDKVTDLFIVVDSKVIHLNTPSVLTGLSQLFKTYFIFNVNYPTAWQPFWELIEHAVMEISPRNLSNAAHEFLSRHSFFCHQMNEK